MSTSFPAFERGFMLSATSSEWAHRIAGGSAVIGAAALLGGCVYVSKVARSGTGYKAQTTCSAVFVSGRDPATLSGFEFAGLHPLLGLVQPKLDRAHREVEASLLGMGRQKSIYRPGLGCTLVDAAAATLPPAPGALMATRALPVDRIEAGVTATPSGIDRQQLERSVADAFAEPDVKNPRNTRALLVVYDGAVIAERYAPGFNKDMPLPGWSMTKTITGALVGIMVGRGAIKVADTAAVPEWQQPGDARGATTVDQLLHMTAGTRWSEKASDPLSEALVMMYHKRSMAAFAAELPLAHAPGTTFNYDSGATNILSRLMRDAMQGNRDAYLALPRTELFDPVGMSSAVLAPDASGTLVGSAQAFATARDWARFGEMYRNDGSVNGQQVLPPGWVAYSSLRNEASRKRGYGAQIWVNQPFGDAPADRPRPTIPADTMLMNGQFGQLTAIVPSRRLVIVRLGETHDWDFSSDPDRLIASIVAAIPAGR